MVCNLLISYLSSSPRLQISHSPPSSSSMCLIKANREIADNPDQMVGILDSRMPMETTRRNALMVLGAERLSSNRKARETKCSPLLLPTMMLSLDSLPLQNLQIVFTLQTPLWTFQRTSERLCTPLLHSSSGLPPSRKLLIPSHSSSGWMLRSLLR